VWIYTIYVVDLTPEPANCSPLFLLLPSRRYEKQSSFFIQAKTAQSNIQGNVFFNGPRAGINANDGFGGGDNIGHNLVFSSCRESGDHGPFNSWDRQPFLTTVAHGLPLGFKGSLAVLVARGAMPHLLAVQTRARLLPALKGAHRFSGAMPHLSGFGCLIVCSMMTSHHGRYALC
jgi:hypothetical protein